MNTTWHIMYIVFTAEDQDYFASGNDGENMESDQRTGVV